jgi:hypothetical protein
MSVQEGTAAFFVGQLRIDTELSADDISTAARMLAPSSIVI